MVLAEEAVDQINARAVQVVDRVQQKLTGRDFKPTVVLSVNDQVDRLIAQATSVENLAMSFIGCVPALTLSSLPSFVVLERISLADLCPLLLCFESGIVHGGSIAK